MSVKGVTMDTGYSWLVLIAAFLANIMSSAVVCCPAIYMVEWADSYYGARAYIALIASINTAVKTLSGVVAGALIHRFGNRCVMFVGSLITTAGLILSVFAYNIYMLYISFGVISGIGVGLMFSPPIIVIYDYFDKYKSFASGIGMCGHSVAVIAILPLLRLLIDVYAWRGSLFWLAGFTLNGCVLAFVFRPGPRSTVVDKIDKIAVVKDDHFTDNKDVNCIDTGLKTTFKDDNFDNDQLSTKKKDASIKTTLKDDNFNDKSTTKKNHVGLKAMFDLSILTQGTYLLFAVAFACNLFQMMVTYQMYTSKAVVEGMDRFSASMLVSVIGTSAAVSRVFFSIVANFKCTNHIAVFGICSTLLGVANIFCFIPDDFLGHAVFCSIMGVSVGGAYTMQPPSLVSLVGTERLPGAFGWTNLFGCLQSLSLPLAGLLYDLTDSFDASFYMAGAVGLLGGLLILILLLIKPKDPVLTQTEEDEEDEEDLEGRGISPITGSLKTQSIYVSSEFGSQIIEPKNQDV